MPGLEEDLSSCDICTEPYNRSTRRPVNCAQCQHNACTSCVRRYLLDTHLDPHCMNCRHGWDRRFLCTILPRSFLDNDLKHHRQELLLSRERSLFPQTMQVIEQRKRLREISSSIHQLELQKTALQNRINDLRGEYRRVRYGNNDTTSTSPNRGFQRPCPVEECRGYVHAETGVCGICSAVVCLDCNVPKVSSDPDHECKEEDVAVWKELNESTRCCPSCHVRIFKISGCNQMWCPHCQTAFNWVTGRIERGQIHNPHYYEWLFREGGQGNNPQQQQQQPGCREREGIPIVHEFMAYVIHAPTETEPWREFHRMVVHADRIELPRVMYRRNHQHDENLGLRIRYLMKGITEKHFKETLQMREKKNCKDTEVFRILEMFRDVGGDVLRTFMSSYSPALNHTRDNLVKYFNESMARVSNDFNCVTPRIVKHGEKLDFATMK